MMNHPLVVHVRVAWWLSPYLHALCFFCAISRREPDWEKLNRVIERALKLKVVRA